MKRSTSRNYKKLSFLMWEHEVDQAYLAQIIGRSTWYVSARFVGDNYWTTEDMYKMSDYFKKLTEGEVDISANFSEYFPHPKDIHNSREMTRKLREAI